MNSFTAQEEPSEAVQYYSAGEPALTDEKFSQMSLESPQQVAEQPHLTMRNEENIQVVPNFDDQKEHGSTPSVSKTTYTCHVCDKRYKHRNCLVKHLWEHHESWELCLKFNLTKHQQVQMMEAAQILVDLACIKQH
ncbi:9088_t:CDS:2 [Acaulospora morrowiae]|uniref:9088_t:CDS:1 n=1 Tax=Acaulospora morrowiae TaxID=94023 RepID=A0A9N9BKF0_9GLOM|nr:9088_t:CDS:2 [Acaulospora morrowiae]